MRSSGGREVRKALTFRLPVTEKSAPIGGRRVLVVGCGFIGTHFVRALHSLGVKTRVLTRSQPDETLQAVVGEELVIADAADAAAVENALAGVSHVVYAAGGLMPAESESDPVGDAALTFPPLIRVLESLRPDVSFTFVSSGGTVYGEPRELPVDETHPTEPISAYGVIKLASEKLVNMYARREGFSARILRCSNVYGEGQPGDRGQGVVATFIAKLVSGEPACVYGDGRIVRDYVYVGDVVSAAMALMERPTHPVIVNVGAGRGHSVSEIIATLEHAAGRELAIDYRPERDFDISEIVLDITRLRALTTFEPRPLAEGISSALAAAETQAAAESPSLPR
jgi:UDP-glucose 4-epimerase